MNSKITSGKGPNVRKASAFLDSKLGKSAILLHPSNKTQLIHTHLFIPKSKRHETIRNSLFTIQLTRKLNRCLSMECLTFSVLLLRLMFTISRLSNYVVLSNIYCQLCISTMRQSDNKANNKKENLPSRTP